MNNRWIDRRLAEIERKIDSVANELSRVLLTDSRNKSKNQAAVTLGRKGGKARVPKGFSKNRKKASEAGKKGAAKRWGKKSKQKPSA